MNSHLIKIIQNYIEYKLKYTDELKLIMRAIYCVLNSFQFYETSINSLNKKNNKMHGYYIKELNKSNEIFWIIALVNNKYKNKIEYKKDFV
jgi:hypothetical protein